MKYSKRYIKPELKEQALQCRIALNRHDEILLRKHGPCWTLPGIDLTHEDKVHEVALNHLRDELNLSPKDLHLLSIARRKRDLKSNEHTMIFFFEATDWDNKNIDKEQETLEKIYLETLFVDNIIELEDSFVQIKSDYQCFSNEQIADMIKNNQIRTCSSEFLKLYSANSLKAYFEY